ncbi:dTDP-4-dehydrorhamnose 3,5-epimerase family protein [Streptomyces sp. NPDC057291]|uniref:dTDP-4-dehydrorhamnose 3,5-epimerase family protein n=1 Tax=Streptomyces sp. NPDC057291 TaxID=3346087 RepID=UPI00363A065C
MSTIKGEAPSARDPLSSAPPGRATYVTFVSGAVLDVVADMWTGSTTFGKWKAVWLDDKAHRRATPAMARPEDLAPQLSEKDAAAPLLGVAEQQAPAGTSGSDVKGSASGGRCSVASNGMGKVECVHELSTCSWPPLRPGCCGTTQHFRPSRPIDVHDGTCGSSPPFG